MCGRIGVRPLSKFSVQGLQTNWLEYMIQTVKTSMRTWYLSGKRKLNFEIKWSQNCTGVLLISLTACPSPPLRYVPPLLNSCFSTFFCTFRCYGYKTDLLIDRDAEIRNMKLMHSHGVGAQLMATFNNGISYEFLKGETLTPESVIQPDIYPLVS